MISYGFIVLAAIFNAFMDIVEAETFSKSIFSHWNPKFWYKRESWKHAKKIFSYPIDGWHLSKSLMIICWAAAVITMDLQHDWWVKLLTIGALWNGTFYLFYDRLFKIK